jgi:hypothetical protein
LVQCITAPTFSTILQTEEGITVLDNAEIVANLLTHQGIVNVGKSRKRSNAIAFCPATFEVAVGWKARWLGGWSK